MCVYVYKYYMLVCMNINKSVSYNTILIIIINFIDAVACPEGEIRLEGTNSAFGGRVEVCLQQSWTTICDVYWDNQDASVLCRQLGFSPYGNTEYQLLASSVDRL